MTPSAPPCRGAARLAARSAGDRGRQGPIRLVTMTTPQLVRARRTDAIWDRQADDGAVCLGPPSRFTLEVTATIQQARARRSITKAGHPRVMPPGSSWADAIAGTPEVCHCLCGEPDWRTVVRACVAVMGRAREVAGDRSTTRAPWNCFPHGSATTSSLRTSRCSQTAMGPLSLRGCRRFRLGRIAYPAKPADLPTISDALAPFQPVKAGPFLALLANKWVGGGWEIWA